MYSPSLSAEHLPPDLPAAEILALWQEAPAETQFLHPAILRAAMADYARRHDDFFAEAYRLELKAQALDDRLARLTGPGRLLRPFLLWHRACLRAQAY
ncbi:hypothetical protein [Stagnihabitans tardus]|uniref:Uncharacterized protein n=1 Tax=Stagnihabitans tardus TaxID=2699202 RepID=A0AAE5BTV9_9RHOB|nr:hypothetical protein [Stagnihabitans tardus]NBZ89495.1 hypothetical protein [Stagnihabitans tardus]